MALKDRWRSARNATASLVKIFLLKSLMVPAMLTPWRIDSVVAILNMFFEVLQLCCDV